MRGTLSDHGAQEAQPLASAMPAADADVAGQELEMRIVAVAALCALISGPVHADWEFTRWTMKLKQIRDATSSEVSSTRHDERFLKRVARGSSVLAFIPRYEWRGHPAEVRFGFDTHARLNGVFLVLDKDRFASVEATLLAAYGAPRLTAEKPLPCRLWLDELQRDYVRLRRLEQTIVDHVPAGVGRAPSCLGPSRHAQAEGQP